MSNRSSSPAAGALAHADEAWSVFLIFLRLGLTSFGGPVAHLGYFREEFVVRRRWLSDASFADLMALCQFLPGPSSSQVGMALGLQRAGYGGALAAWAGFTLPSAVLLILFALSVSTLGESTVPGVLHGLKLAAVAVVAQAVWSMATTLCRGAVRATIMAAAACIVLLVPYAWGQVAAIVVGALVGLWLLRAAPREASETLPLSVSCRTGTAWLLLFLALLFALPVAAQVFASPLLDTVDAFYRTGSMVFGGGHVVLPLLRAEMVPPGWIDDDIFLAGYGAAQAVPGPLFSFAAFLGASMNAAVRGWTGGLLCLIAIFLPSFFLVAGALPFWERLRRGELTQAALGGVNAAVVGLLVAALYQPVWVSAIQHDTDFALALVALLALSVWRLPPWLVVALCGAAGWGLQGLA
jgi:chromate transporter